MCQQLPGAGSGDGCADERRSDTRRLSLEAAHAVRPVADDAVLWSGGGLAAGREAMPRAVIDCRVLIASYVVAPVEERQHRHRERAGEREHGGGREQQGAPEGAKHQLTG